MNKKRFESFLVAVDDSELRPANPHEIEGATRG